MELTNNADFLKNLDETVKNIQSDGKLDVKDVPDLIYLIINFYNSLSKSKLSNIKLPSLIQSIFNFIIHKYKLLNENDVAIIENIVNASIKLAMMIPVVKDGVEKISSKCVCW
jgi:hypothetical protein